MNIPYIRLLTIYIYSNIYIAPGFLDPGCGILTKFLSVCSSDTNVKKLFNCKNHRHHMHKGISKLQLRKTIHSTAAGGKSERVTNLAKG